MSEERVGYKADRAIEEAEIQNIAREILIGFSVNPGLLYNRPSNQQLIDIAFEWADTFAIRCRRREKEKKL